MTYKTPFGEKYYWDPDDSFDEQHNRDVPNVKTLYPKLKPDMPNPLDPKFVRPFSFLIGFNVELKAAMGGNSVVLATSRANPVILGVLCKHL